MDFYEFEKILQKEYNAGNSIEKWMGEYIKYIKNHFGGDNLKDELILLRCEKEEKKQIKRDAEKHDKSVSDYIRYLVAKERKEMGEREK